MMNLDYELGAGACRISINLAVRQVTHSVALAARGIRGKKKKLSEFLNSVLPVGTLRNSTGKGN